MTKKLVTLRGGALKTLAVTSAPLTWRDYLKAYYAKAFAVLSELLAVGNLMTPAFSYLPLHEKHYVTAGLIILGVVVTVMSRERVWVEGHLNEKVA